MSARDEGGGRVAPGDGNRSTGYPSSSAVSPRPTAGRTVTDLEGDLLGRRSSGYPSMPSSRVAPPAGSDPAGVTVPRGYVNNDSSAQPTVRDTTGGRLRKVKP